MSTPNIELKDVVEQAQDTLDSIRAVKGDKYARSIKAALNASSLTYVISAAIAGKLPPEMGNTMLLMLVTEYVTTVCDANGTPWDDEMEGWVNRIKQNTEATVGAMMKAGNNPLQ